MTLGQVATVLLALPTPDVTKFQPQSVAQPNKLTEPRMSDNYSQLNDACKHDRVGRCPLMQAEPVETPMSDHPSQHSKSVKLGPTIQGVNQDQRVRIGTSDPNI